MYNINTEKLDQIIVGRVDPHIYAFTTGTVPEYLKVGDTYRPVSVRLQEWRAFFPDLKQQYEHVAKTTNGKYYRDFAIHYYLETIKGLHRLLPNELQIPYYSREFFQHATNEDIDKAILDIEEYASKSGQTRYQFYSEDRLPQVEHYERKETFDPRPNQDDTIKAFKAAREKGRKHLLMYAVMRFGKSFTSMCCATEMKAKVVLIVSAKADVREEWKYTVESHVRFKDYIFLDSDALVAEPKAISKIVKQDKCVAVFLTLQDLMGDDIKTKHKDLFKNTVNLLIVDETHFGARAEEYGKVLRNANLSAAQIRKEQTNLDDTLDSLEKGLDQLKTLKTDTTLHLSGTPYRILMGSEFSKDDIIAFYQFSDIIDDKEKWDRKYLIDDDVKEWDNPYYGFPQMIRFAFHPNASSRRLLKEMRESGLTAALNELFRPASISQDIGGKYKQFAHPKEVLDLLEIIDGSQQEEDLLSFLDYSKLKEGKMCHHMVFVLPFCASCDAMETLLKKHKRKFKNLGQYEIINIAGKDSVFSDNDEVKKKISTAEDAGKKTISLTVNKMLTGCTVPEWDTMLFLKDVSSPQEYDQAIFRLQNQFIKRFVDEKGDVVKYNMKPQTLLVDFDVNRMFHMQEQKALIYNVNIEGRGNDELEERLKRELEISPIIILNKDKLVEATPTNIMDAVREYSTSRTILDEATDIPVDTQLFTDPLILNLLKDISPITHNKGIDIKPVEGEPTEIDFSTDVSSTERGDGQKSSSSQRFSEDEDKKLDKRLETYYSQILFYAMLTDSMVHSLNEIIEDISISENNRRIASHVGLAPQVLRYLSQRINPFILNKLDYKIKNINNLMRDENLPSFDRVELALKKFGRLSGSEVVTPTAIIEKMIDQIPSRLINEHSLFLDVASKEGEFTCALYKHLRERFGERIRNNIYAIPTSTLTYELTRRVYGLLGMPLEHVFEGITSYELNNKNTEKINQIFQGMQFDVVLGNPPYDGNLHLQVIDSVRPFMSALGLGVFIHPARWYEDPVADLKKGADKIKFKEITKRLKDIKLIDYTTANSRFGIANNGDLMISVISSHECETPPKIHNILAEEAISILSQFVKEHNIASLHPEENMVDGIRVRVSEMVPLATKNQAGPTTEIAPIRNCIGTTAYYKGRNTETKKFWTEERTKTGRYKKDGSPFPWSVRFDTVEHARNFAESCHCEFFWNWTYLVKLDMHTPFKFMPLMDNYDQPWDNARYCKFFEINYGMSKDCQSWMCRTINDYRVKDYLNYEEF